MYLLTKKFLLTHKATVAPIVFAVQHVWHVLFCRLLAAGMLIGFTYPASAQTAAEKPVMPPTTNPSTIGTAPAPLTIPPAVLPAPYLPFPRLPALPLDEAHNGIGIAQQTARAQKLQARILWIDATANLNNFNTVAKIDALVQRIKKSGFNTIVLEVKPIVGQTIYPSKYAPKLTNWRDRTLPVEFDPLPEFINQAHAAGLQLVAGLNVFSEGHRGDNNTLKQQGPGYQHPEWQTVLYSVQMKVHTTTPAAVTFDLSPQANRPAPDMQHLALYTDISAYTPKPTAFAVLLDAGSKVTGILEGPTLPLLGKLPVNGAAVIGEGPGADFLRQNVHLDDTLALDTMPAYVPMSQMQEQVPLMVNPHRADVRQRMLDILTELCSTYALDGVIFDDRFRYAGINADFSEETRKQFEVYVGKALAWPNDVLHYDIAFPSLTRRVIPGPYYDTWLTWRSLTLRNWLADAVTTVKRVRPQATVSVYAGSWYGEYPQIGPNWAADDFEAGFRFLTPTYQKTGFAGMLDWITTGCYYPTACIADALAAGKSAGASVEAAGQLCNRAVNDQTWIYAGLNVGDYMPKPFQPDALQRALQAAVASTQGVMVFDLSYFNDDLWAVFEDAFRDPAVAPQTVPGLLDQVRKQHLARKAAGQVDPPVIILNGIPGTGL